MSDESATRPRVIEPVVPHVALNRRQCAEALGVSARLVDSLIAGRRGNKFSVVYLNSKPVIPLDPLREWLAR